MTRRESGSTRRRGDTLKLELEGMTFNPVVQENSAAEFRWLGSTLMGALASEHFFRFEPSQQMPGSTLLVHGEELSRLMDVMMNPPFPFGKKTQDGFAGFSRDLKAHVESRERAK